MLDPHGNARTRNNVYTPVPRPSKLRQNLASQGVNLDVVQDSGDTALSLAAFFGRPDAVAELVSRGADAGCRDNEGLTPGEAFDVGVDRSIQYQIQVRP